MSNCDCIKSRLKTSYFISASVYNTLWAGLQNRARDSNTLKHFKVLWLTTLIRQFMELTLGEQQIFLEEVRRRNGVAREPVGRTTRQVPVLSLASPGQTSPTAGPSGRNNPTAGPSGRTSPTAGPSGRTSPTPGPSGRSQGPHIAGPAKKQRKK